MSADRVRLDFAKFPSTVAIVGSRKFPSKQWVESFVDRLDLETRVVSGGAKGVDTWAYERAAFHDMPRWVWPIRQDRIDAVGFRAAAFERNKEIVMDVKMSSGLLVAFLLDPAETGGTEDTLKKCDHYDVPYFAFRMTKDFQWTTPRVGKSVARHPKWSALILPS